MLSADTQALLNQALSAVDGEVTALGGVTATVSYKGKDERILAMFVYTVDPKLCGLLAPLVALADAPKEVADG